MQHCGDSLGHNDDGGVVCLGFQGTAQGHVGLVIQRREAVIKQVDARLFSDGTRNGKTLFLPADEIIL